ncbi:hypothetical protein LZD49_34830 [Dyadobacter sp. CY261]|uniref:hypothetical protein n=1 Tax=Dyadobacter sp. CY261 TaxID=2907203 RepID=UPI001F34C209|nr:hypothetical protein [Dyadobacter sp. CY261]MCF0075699.1 hypothetical protein [Dyadobacter sp. CY261]
MERSGLDIAWEKFFVDQLTPEEECLLIKYFENNPLDEMAVFESEKGQIGRRIRKKLYSKTIHQL